MQSSNFSINCNASLNPHSRKRKYQQTIAHLLSKLSVFEMGWGEIIQNVPSLLVIKCCQKLSHCYLHNVYGILSLMQRYLIALQDKVTSKLPNLAIKHQNSNFNSTIRIVMSSNQSSLQWFSVCCLIKEITLHLALAMTCKMSQYKYYLTLHTYTLILALSFKPLF